MKNTMKKLFYNEKVILVLVVINAIAIYLIESGIGGKPLVALDMFCTCFFIVEMVVKLIYEGWKGYWKENWNRLNGTLVLLSLPSIITQLLDIDVFNFSVLFTLRLLRSFRVFRIFYIFPEKETRKLLIGLKRALRQSGVVLFGFVVLILVFGLINCSLYKEVAPQYFNTPFRSIYTAFRMVTLEGWYDVPDAIAVGTSSIIGKLSRIYFCIQISIGGILGLSFINSVFVDAMVEDNNDDVKEQLTSIENKLREITELLEQKEETVPSKK